MRKAVVAHPLAATSGAAVLLGMLLTALAAVLPLTDEAKHAALHLVMGVPAALLVASSRRLWPSPHPDRLSRGARAVLVGGLALLAVASLPDAVGAFGFVGDARVNVLAYLHDLAALGGMAGFYTTLLGLGLSLLAKVAVRLGLVPADPSRPPERMNT